MLHIVFLYSYGMCICLYDRVLGETVNYLMIATSSKNHFLSKIIEINDHKRLNNSGSSYM